MYVSLTTLIMLCVLLKYANIYVYLYSRVCPLYCIHVKNKRKYNKPCYSNLNTCILDRSRGQRSSGVSFFKATVLLQHLNSCRKDHVLPPLLKWRISLLQELLPWSTSLQCRKHTAWNPASLKAMANCFGVSFQPVVFKVVQKYIEKN